MDKPCTRSANRCAGVVKSRKTSPAAPTPSSQDSLPARAVITRYIRELGPGIDPTRARIQGLAAPDRPGCTTSPTLEPLAHIRPKPGNLVLFPSSLWHSTEPFYGEADRLTVAFDIVPETRAWIRPCEKSFPFFVFLPEGSRRTCVLP
ncbi:putative 2OG-Fe(II) oxygenase [Novosphingobium sp. BW1]|uniref:putative 2OG-Fe(II) oxygenase n=1 Tax=Novosphingobium sp. BW1 TaxID=2592621 RepID=UPI0011DE94A6|nr:putative 2OG-Fe(II) oxygenase [Novosphingobium sp. BW1]TYC86895.1 hypothetical protein FMM79_13615 [Novosphingobium sp. BW1]